MPVEAKQLASTLSPARRRARAGHRLAASPAGSASLRRSHLAASQAIGSLLSRKIMSEANIFCGEGGIRTHGSLRYDGFQDRSSTTTLVPLQRIF